MTTVSAALTRFYSEGLADAAFLAAQGIYYCHCEEDYSLFAEYSPTGPLRVYVIDRHEGLFLLDAAFLQRETAGDAFAPEWLEQVALQAAWQEGPIEQVGQRVLHGEETGAPPTHPNLSVRARAAGKAAGASEDQLWCYVTFMELALLGEAPQCQLQYTAEGVRVQLLDPTDSFGEDEQLLDQLQDLGLVRVQRQPGKAGFLLQVQQAALAPAIVLPLLPRFLTAVLY